MTDLTVMTDEELSRYGTTEGCGFGALETERGVLPLVALRVRARVSGVVAATEVVQTFANTTGIAIEATYIFPLPDRAAVHRFRMEVGGRVVEGIVDERAQARADYDAAIAAGHRAAIAEEERPGVFTLRVGNLMPGDRATVTLSLVGPLPIDDGEATFRFPLVVAPRYIPGAALGGEQAGLGGAGDTDLVPDASRISPPVRLPGLPNPVQLAIEVAFDAPAKQLSSSLHAVSDDGRVVRLLPGERLDRDFIVRWRVDGDGELRSSLVCADDPDGRGGTFMLTLAPPSTRAVGGKPRDVVIVLDRSGSMGGWKMVAARRAAARLIDSLTSRDRFCAIAFDDHVEMIPDALADATDRARFRAVEQLAHVEARGGTEIAAPLSAAVDMLAGGYADRERVVVLITDGQVGSEDQVLRMLAARVKNVRIFTLGIDQAVNAAFLYRLAGLGAGICELVESEDRLDAVMSKFHRRIGAPIATELALSEKRLELEYGSLAPSRVPDVYAGAPVVVLGRYLGAAPPDAAIELDGTSLGDKLHDVVVRTPAAPGETSWLGASWARARIRDLEDRYAIGERHHEAEIVRLSKRFTVLSRFTAFLAVDRSDVANPGGKLKQVVQPVETPAGWDSLAGAANVRTMTGTLKHVTLPSSIPSPMRAPLGIAKSMAMPAQMPSSNAPMMPAGGGPTMPHFSPPPAAAKKPAAAAASRDVSRHDEVAPPQIPVEPYLAKLGELARALAAATSPTGLRIARQRLVEWLEDARSIGFAELSTAVAAIVQPLHGTLDEPTARAVATALEDLVRRGHVPTPPAKKSRLAFWK
jgi:Ca-activated chloride channel family protein